MTTLTIELHELRWLLSAALPFAAKDLSAFPSLEAVRLETRGGYVTATATDRYVVGMARVKAKGAKGFEALIRAKDVRHILATFKNRRGVFSTVNLGVTPGKPGSVTVGLADGLFAGAVDLTARYELVDGDFPKLGKIFREWKPSTKPVGAFNPAYLAKFANVTREHRDPVQVSIGVRTSKVAGEDPTSGPALVQAGDYFLGAIMPVRGAGVDAAADVATWLESAA